MKSKSTYMYIAAYLALLIPTPGRFVFGITVLLELLILTGVGVLINSLINKLNLQLMKTVILMTSMIAVSILYRQIFIILQTEVALTLGFIFYLPAVSLFTIGFLYYEPEKSLKERSAYCFGHVALFCATGLGFFLFRDIAGYGTFTFFGKDHMIFEKVLFDATDVGILTFVSSIPGALILAGICLFVYTHYKEKFEIIAKGEEHK